MEIIEGKLHATTAELENLVEARSFDPMITKVLEIAGVMPGGLFDDAAPIVNAAKAGLVAEVTDGSYRAEVIEKAIKATTGSTHNKGSMLTLAEMDAVIQKTIPHAKFW